MTSTLPPQDLIFVIGCPGAGKGTLCSKLATKWSWAHVSVGDELRRYCLSHDQENNAVIRCVRKGELVPVEQLAQILQDGINRLRNEGYSSFIIDGFPRDADQIQYIQDKIGVPCRVLLMECPQDIARKRVLSRQISGRTDTDTEEIFEKRFSEFQSKNPSIATHFKAEGKLLKIDTSHTTDISFQHLLMVLEPSTGLLNIGSRNRLLSGRLVSRDGSAKTAESKIHHASTIIYLIGASAAGKTTLVETLSDHFRLHESSRPVAVVSEVARELVLRERVDPQDIQLGREVGMDLQRQILDEQKQREQNGSQDSNLLLCDRSGLDPIVFAVRYGKGLRHQQLLSSSAWLYLKPRMQRSLVILCEPSLEWFTADGVRVDAGSATEQAELHALFVQLLQSEAISYKVLPASVTDRQARVDLVLTAMLNFEKKECDGESVESASG